MEDSDRCQPVSCFDYGWSARRSRVEGASPYATTVAFLAAFFGRRPNCRLTARQERRREGAGVPWSCGGADLPTARRGPSDDAAHRTTAAGGRLGRERCPA